jgi:hypothetical protein
MFYFILIAFSVLSSDLHSSLAFSSVVAAAFNLSLVAADWFLSVAVTVQESLHIGTSVLLPAGSTLRGPLTLGTCTSSKLGRTACLLK